MHMSPGHFHRVMSQNYQITPMRKVFELRMQRAAALLTQMQHELRTRHGVADPDHEFLMGLQRCSKAALPRWLAQRCAPPAVTA